MCMALYLATDELIPTTEWSTGSVPIFQALEPTEEKVRRQFTKPEVRYVGSHSRCSCGFLYDPASPDAELTLQSIDALRALVSSLVGDQGEVELFYCWEGDEGREADSRLHTTVSEIGSESCPLNTTTFYRVRGRRPTSG